MNALTTKLIDAVREFKLEEAEAALEEGADINAGDHRGYNALQTAVTTGNFGAVQLLLDRGADVHATGSSERSAAFLAIARPDARLLDMLINAGARLERDVERHPEILALAAAKMKDADGGVVKKLLACGADPRQAFDKGRTALHEAAQENGVGSCLVLVRAGANLEATDSRGVRPIQLAAAMEHREATATLRALGASAWSVVALKDGIEKILDEPSRLQCAMWSNSEHVLLHVLENHGHEIARDEVDRVLAPSTTKKKPEMVTMLRSWAARHAANEAMREIDCEMDHARRAP